jgi:hypothetical protein
MITFEGDHTGNMITLSPLDIEDHQKKNSRECSFERFGEDDQNGAGKPVATEGLLP